MVKEAGQLPDEDRPNIRPDLPGLRESEQAGSTAEATGSDSGNMAVPASELTDAEKGNTGFFKKEEGSGGLAGTSGESVESESNGNWLQRRLGRVNKKRAGIIAALLLGVSGSGVGVFLFFLPLKVEHMVNNLQDTFFSSSEDAVQKQSDRLFQRYLITRVFPAYQSCGTTTKKGCTAHVGGQGPVASLYNSWSNAKLETKMADRGLKFEYDRGSNTWKMHYPGAAKDGVPIGSDGSGITQEFDGRSDARKAFRAEFDKAFDKETRWKKIMYRYKVGRLMETKYGVKRCIVFCGTRDSIGDKRDDKINAAQLYLVKRVIEPRNATLSIALECLLSGCDPTKTEPTGEANANNGAPENADTDTKIQAKLSELSDSGFDVEAYKKLYGEISEDGFQKYLTSKALAPIIGETAAGRAGSVVPVVGWFNLAAQIVGAGDNAGPAIKKLSYLTNAAAAVGTYMTYRSYADEIHMSEVDATEIGSFSTALGAGDHGAASDPIKGGTSGAEGTPLYAKLIDGKSSDAASGRVSLLNNVLPSASAASNDTSAEGSTDYKCNNGDPVPSGHLVCSEEYLGGGNAVANSVHDFLNLPGLNVITNIAQAWNNSVGKVFDFAGGVLGSAMSLTTKPLNAACELPSAAVSAVPGASVYCPAKDLAEENIPKIVEGVTKWLIPNPFSTNMSGGRTFDMMAAGADVAGNDYAHTGLGAQQISDGQVAEIRNEQRSQEEISFSNQPLFARLFDTNNSHSLVSKIAMAVPYGRQAAAQQSLATLINPLKTIGNGFSNLLSGRVLAATAADPDPFGVTQYGYPDNAIPEDPEAYWDANCSDNAAYAYRKDNSWNEAASKNVDPNTGTPLNTTPNPCLLIMASVGSSGGWFDADNLTDDDRTVYGDATDDSSSDAQVSGDAKELAQQILDSKNVTYPYVDSSGHTAREVLEDVAKTGSGFTDAADAPSPKTTLSVNMLKTILEYAQGGSSLGINCLSNCTHSSSSSEHYTGQAVDLNCTPSLDEGKWNEIMKKYGGSLDSGYPETCPGNQHWHFRFPKGGS
jgi:hypothetical protein